MTVTEVTGKRCLTFGYELRNADATRYVAKTKKKDSPSPLLPGPTCLLLGKHSPLGKSLRVNRGMQGECMQARRCCQCEVCEGVKSQQVLIRNRVCHECPQGFTWPLPVLAISKARISSGHIKQTEVLSAFDLTSDKFTLGTTILEYVMV